MDLFDEDRDRRRGKNPFDFMSDEEFERIVDEIQRIIESASFREIFKQILRENLESNNQSIRALSINIIPVGKPKIQVFRNRRLKTLHGKPMISERQEPLTDIVEGDEEVAVTVEIPGVEKEDFDLNVSENSLEIVVEKHGEKYHKSLDLPCKVKPKTMETTYKNGVLDVVIKKKNKKKPVNDTEQL